MPRKAMNPNRTDLMAKQAIKTPTGLPYGEHQQLDAAQRAIPLPNENAPVPAPNDSLPAALEAAGQMNPPGGGLGQPSERPNEPVQAGLPSGPGPGPSPVFPMQVNTLGGLLNQLAAQPGASPDVAYLQSVVNGGAI